MYRTHSLLSLTIYLCICILNSGLRTWIRTCYVYYEQYVRRWSSDVGGSNLSGYCTPCEQRLQQALGKAAVRGISSFRAQPERDQYRNILAVLAQPGFHNEELRREALRLFTLSDAPDLQALSDIYNRARRVQTLALPQPSAPVDATPYLAAFFSALLNELYNDEVFGEQVRQVLDARAAKTTQERLPQIAEGIQELTAGVKQILRAVAPDY